MRSHLPRVLTGSATAALSAAAVVMAAGRGTTTRVLALSLARAPVGSRAVLDRTLRRLRVDHLRAAVCTAVAGLRWRGGIVVVIRGRRRGARCRFGGPRHGRCLRWSRGSGSCGGLRGRLGRLGRSARVRSGGWRVGALHGRPWPGGLSWSGDRLSQREGVRDDDGFEGGPQSVRLFDGPGLRDRRRRAEGQRRGDAEHYPAAARRSGSRPHSASRPPARPCAGRVIRRHARTADRVARIHTCRAWRTLIDWESPDR